MRKLQLFSIVIISFIIHSFKPYGSGTAYITGKSSSGNIILKAEIQDISGVVEKIDLTIDNKKIIFDENCDSKIIFNSKDAVYTIFAENKNNENRNTYKFFKFWVLPKTFKIINPSRSEKLYRFKAKIVCTEPRVGKDLITPELIINCEMKYSI